LEDPTVRNWGTIWRLLLIGLLVAIVLALLVTVLASR